MESSRAARGHLISFKLFVAVIAIFFGTFFTIIGAVYISIGVEVLNSNSTKCAASNMTCPSGYGSQMGGGLALAVGLAILAATVSPFLYFVLKPPTKKTPEHANAFCKFC